MSRSFKEVLASFKKDIACGFQAQKNLVDISAKYLGELEAAYDGGGVGGINYSTDEQDTGLKWIDGSAIYQKTINFGALPSSSTTKSVEHGISNMAYIVNIFGVTTDGTNMFPIMLTDDSSTGIVRLLMNKTNLQVWTGTDRSSYSAYITIQYTKSA